MNLTSLLAQVKQPLTVAGVIPANPTTVSFLDYLSGNVENSDARDKQEPLKYAKIDGASHSSTGIADVEVMLGYTFWFKNRIRKDFHISMIIPTGKTPKGEYLFEPVHGNGHHWGVGVGFDACLTLWDCKDADKSIELLVVGKYKYLFEGREKRTLDFEWAYPGPTDLNAALYYNLGGQAGQNKVFPLVNVLTQDIRVIPGSHFDGIVALACNIGKFTFDIGYNVFYKEQERVSLRFPWENDTYAVAATAYQTDANAFQTLYNPGGAFQSAYGGANSEVQDKNVAIQNTHLDLSSVTSPYQVTHKIYGGLGYEWYKMKYPIMISAGGSYEYSSRNAALEGWAIWAKGGLSW